MVDKLRRRALSSIAACIAKDDDLRSPAAHAAFARVIEQSTSGVVLSVGGGPRRVHAALLNLNIVFDENVDVVGSAYGLPFKDVSVAAAHCEAVLEHLEYVEKAVAEIFRVLRPQGLLFAATPFLQPYHGYPDHFQNFTLRGHIRLFERAGFVIIDSGTCVGPTFAIVDIAANYARELFPTKLLSRGLERLIKYVGRPFRLADLAMRELPGSSILCSSTFVFAKKPG